MPWGEKKFTGFSTLVRRLQQQILENRENILNPVAANSMTSGEAELF